MFASFSSDVEIQQVGHDPEKVCEKRIVFMAFANSYWPVMKLQPLKYV